MLNQPTYQLLVQTIKQYNYNTSHKQLSQKYKHLLFIQYMTAQPPQKPLPYSLLTSMYQHWEEYSIPAVYYHYILSVMPKLQKKQQVLIMTKQIKSLKSNTHAYHNIINAIQARQRSLSIIRQNIYILMKYQSTEDMQWPNNHIQLEFDNYSIANPTVKQNNIYNKSKNKQQEYNVLYQDPQSPILSPPSLLSPSSSLSKNKNNSNKLSQLINHINIYRKVTAQIIYMIAQWENQIKQYGYKESIIQFLYHKQDYMHRINIDILDILDKYQNIFENNPFLILKKLHEKTQYALIYRDLKLNTDMNKKIQQCCNIIANHQADILRFRMLAKVGQSTNRRRSLTKSTDIDKIYNNFNNGKDYIVVRDTQAMKKSKISVQPILSRVKKYQNSINVNDQIQKTNKRIKQLKNSIIINPQARYPFAIDKTVRKHPVKAELIHLINDNRRGITKEQVYFKTPKQLEKPQQRRYKSDKDDLQTSSKLKRSLTERQIDMRKYSMATNNSEQTNKYDNKSLRSLKTKYGEKLSVKPIHGQNNIIVQKRNNNNRQDQLNRNMGLSTQRKVDMIDQLNSQLKHKVKSLSQALQQHKIQQRTRPIFDQPPSPLKSTKSEYQNIQQNISQNKQQAGELSSQNKISLTFQQNIKSTQIVKYLRAKVFNNSPQVSFQEIQSIAKKILAQKDLITFIRVESGDMKIAWLAVKFIQKDQTMRRCVFIVYVRKFIRLTNFQRKLLDNFVEHGYGLIRNQQKILYQIDILDIVVKPLIKIKYKINSKIQKKQIKQITKKYPTIAQTRILKYHYYSKDSKYHTYCQHQNNNCNISYNFLQICKINVDNKSYIRAKADRISKLDENVYRIKCIINETDLIIANTLTDIYQLQKQTQIQKDSSFDEKQNNYEIKHKYLALRYGKIMKKYVNDIDQIVISQFITINGSIPEVRSISMNKLEASQNTLFVNPPYFMAIMTRDVGQAKTLAVLEFQ